MRFKSGENNMRLFPVCTFSMDTEVDGWIQGGLKLFCFQGFVFTSKWIKSHITPIEYNEGV